LRYSAIIDNSRESVQELVYSRQRIKKSPIEVKDQKNSKKNGRSHIQERKRNKVVSSKRQGNQEEMERVYNVQQVP